MYTVVALILGLLGSGILIAALMRVPRALGSRHWPETTGKVTAVSVTRIWLGRGSLHFPDIRYEYRVGEAQLTGQRIGFVWRLPWLSYGAALYVLQHAYPRGKSVTVRYDPAEPSDAVLEPGILTGLRAMIGIGVLCMLASCVVWIVFRA